MAQIQLVIVTPETTTLDQMVDSVVVPMVDGETGIYPGFAPMIGRLGPGELRAKVAGASERFYVDGGFVQVENDVVTVLPGKSLPAGEIVLADAKAALQAARAQPAGNPELAAIKANNITKARAQLRVAGKA